MTDNELLLAIYNDIQSMKDELETVKRDVKHLKKEAIKMQAMDEAILDEAERVHGILDKHKEDKSVHTA
ncbi:MAG: hypothetical protein HFH05_16510 [Lachnospiraceae bacterium]|nr:hypothetical protein [Lachnospiraceae bacterium]